MADRTAAVLARTVRAAARRVARPEPNADLLAAFLRHGDPAAFERLVRRYGPLVRAACRAVLADPADADDAFQATFVALHKKAHTVRDGRTLGGWLFRVARRTALGLKAAGTRRRDCETRAARREPVGEPDVSWREACAVLHEELDRLPPRYRLPLILCYLDGKTRDEAAAELGWTPDSVRGRLDRGRLRLRGRLEKRGITLSAFLLTAVAADAVPPALVVSTLTTCRTAWNSLPLVAGVWKPGLIAGFAVAVVVGLAFRKDGANGQPTPQKSVVPTTAKPVDVRKTMSGVVVGPDGKPVAGATVTIRRKFQDVDGVAARTGSDGRFRVELPDVPADTPMIAMAWANGFAAGWTDWQGPVPEEARIALAADDVPIRGRLLNTEGKPVAGAAVRLTSVDDIPDGGARAYVRRMSARAGRPVRHDIPFAPPGATAEAVTDAAGRFRLTGIGRDRVAALQFTGPGIAIETVEVATLPDLGPDSGRAAAARRVFPAAFDHVVSPGRLVRGTARDADTGRPVAGLVVNGPAGLTRTDRDGHYELPGYKKGPRYTVHARPVDGSVYFPAMAEAADTAGLDPLTVDLKVKAGVPVRGRLKDAATGKPVAGSVQYWALAGNPNVADVSVGEKVAEFYTVEVRTKADGSFTCAALPGRGFLTVVADGGYQAARVEPKGFADDAGALATPDQLPVAVGGAGITSLTQEAYQAVRLLTVDPVKPADELAIELTPTEPVRGRLVDPDGNPLTGVRVRGLHMSGDGWSNPLTTAEFTARPPHPDRPRRLSFRHDGRKLAGTAVVRSGGGKPLEFKLEPWATLTGRLADADGAPPTQATVFVVAAHPDAPVPDSIGPATVGRDGRFHVDGLIPGVRYRVLCRVPQVPRPGTPPPPEVTLKPGEERDLGLLKVGGP